MNKMDEWADGIEQTLLGAAGAGDGVPMGVVDNIPEGTIVDDKVVSLTFHSLESDIGFPSLRYLFPRGPDLAEIGRKLNPDIRFRFFAERVSTSLRTGIRLLLGRCLKWRGEMGTSWARARTCSANRQ